MPYSGDDDKQKVLAASDIVAVIGEQLALKPKGREFASLCPFHDDHNPSMAVVPEKQIYHCFVCGAGGDVFSFVMRYHKLSFPEALKHLADRAGIELTGRRERRDDGQASLRQRIAEANQLALRFFKARFQDDALGQIAREYTEKRGITPEMIERFEIGYAPDSWDDMANAIARKHYDLEAFVAAGLIAKRDRGPGHFDRLRHRLIFPIADALGRPVAFGGRRLREEDNPKYWNSPETELFHKSATLFGLHLAKRAIINSRTAVIVEGYTDVIAAHQVGRDNVVATLGTALTPQHVKELRRFADRIVLVFDGDTAGRKAADRAVEAFLTEEVDTAVAILPGGQDPADLLASPEGLDTWDQLIDQAPDALLFGLDRMAEDAGQAKTLTGKQKVGEEYAAKLIRLGLDRTDSTRRALILDRVANILGLNHAATADLIQAARNTLRSQKRPDKAGIPENLEPFALRDTKRLDLSLSSRTLNLALAAERQVIACLIRHNELFTKPLDQGAAIDESFTPADPVGTVNQMIYARVYRALASGLSVTLEGLLADSAETENHELADQLARLGRDIQDLGLDDPVTAEQLLRQAYRSWHAAVPSRDPAEEQPSSDEQKLRDTLERLRSTVTPGRISGRGTPTG